MEHCNSGDFQIFLWEQSSIPAMLGYAVFVTVLAVIFTVWIGFVSGKAKRRSEKISKKIPLHKHSAEEKKEE